MMKLKLQNKKCLNKKTNHLSLQQNHHQQLFDNQATSTSQYVRRKGEAPVKLEYIIFEKPIPSTEATTSSSTEDNESEKKRKHEGDNKNSKKAKSFHNRTRDALKKSKKEKNADRK